MMRADLKVVVGEGVAEEGKRGARAKVWAKARVKAAGKERARVKGVVQLGRARLARERKRVKKRVVPQGWCPKAC